jgi:hypothetical protein
VIEDRDFCVGLWEVFAVYVNLHLHYAL